MFCNTAYPVDDISPQWFFCDMNSVLPNNSVLIYNAHVAIYVAIFLYCTLIIYQILG